MECVFMTARGQRKGDDIITCQSSAGWLWKLGEWTVPGSGMKILKGAACEFDLQ